MCVSLYMTTVFCFYFDYSGLFIHFLFACFLKRERAWGSVNVEDLGRVEVEKTTIRIHCMKKVFSIKKKKEVVD